MAAIKSKPPFFQKALKMREERIGRMENTKDKAILNKQCIGGG